MRPASGGNPTTFEFTTTYLQRRPLYYIGQSVFFTVEKIFLFSKRTRLFAAVVGLAPVVIELLLEFDLKRFQCTYASFFYRVQFVTTNGSILYDKVFPMKHVYK
jgi:hypothetical protein